MWSIIYQIFILQDSYIKYKLDFHVISLKLLNYSWIIFLPSFAIVCLYYKVRCVFACHNRFVPTLTSPPIWRYGIPKIPMASLWPNGGNKTIWDNIQAKKLFFKKKNTLCHSFRISVIPSIVLSFLPDYCHSFQIISHICHPE